MGLRQGHPCSRFNNLLGGGVEVFGAHDPGRSVAAGIQISLDALECGG